MSEQRLIDANKLTVTHINEVDVWGYKLKYGTGIPVVLLSDIEHASTIEPERKKMSNKEWVDFLSEQFTVSRTSAREMLHGLMKWKAEDNFKKQFSGGKNEKE